MKTKVIFRKFKDLGDVIAFFPYEPADHLGNCVSYQRIGQHGAADYSGCLENTVPASESEYSSLQKELNKIGYDLIVIKRVNRK